VDVRDATADDVPALARVHVESRRTAFSRVLPREVADSWTVDERVGTWRDVLADPGLGTRSFALVATEGAEVVGLASGGAIPVDEPGFRGEVGRLYVATPSQGRGVGRALFLALTRRLARAGLEPFLVWTPARNGGARRFYERLGGRLVREAPGVPTRVGIPVDKVAYGWAEAPPALRFP
jgi:ribosomal protein S18 acetylase RimI-like enzyme